MSEYFKVVIIGAGPAGISAAARAAELGVSHVLLEASAQPAHTICKYQKGKHVMAEPAILPLRSSVRFAAGRREEVLHIWKEDLQAHGVNLRLGAAVVGVQGQRGEFKVALASGETLSAEFVVLALGLQGNIRKLGVRGEDLPRVQYQLDDPEDFEDETIVVVGGGDAGVENALALAEHNRVFIINREEEFTRCNEGNLHLLQQAIKEGKIEPRLNTRVDHVEELDVGGFALQLEAKTPEGTEHILCHRVIARLGASPPRQLVESFGVKFPHADVNSVPALSAQYESNVPGLYIIGALAGYPLIKQALNHGYEVIEYLLGHTVEPADEALLQEKLHVFLPNHTVNRALRVIQRDVPLLSGLTTLQLREFLLESDVFAPAQDEIIFERNDYSNTFFTILDGEFLAYTEDKNHETISYRLSRGNFFGEMGLLSGRRRVGTVKAATAGVLIETPRRSMLKLIRTVEAVRHMLDDISLRRAVQACLGGGLNDEELDYLVRNATVKKFDAGQNIFLQGDKADGLYLIRRGSVMIVRMNDGREEVLSYVAAGNYVGEKALISDMPRSATVRTAVPTETILLETRAVTEMLARNEAMRDVVLTRYRENVRAEQQLENRNQERDGLFNFLMQQGVGEATDVLLIDYSLCIRCDHCETACADTHGGASRLNREAGPTYANIHIPTSCRHCEHPHCMKDCPPDAIHRSINGEVYINDSCIGCGNCEKNCPYDVIQMAVVDPQYQQRSFLEVLFGRVAGWGKRDRELSASKKAVKCDMCRDIASGPVCVRLCPTGAARRVSPEKLALTARNDRQEMET